MCIVYNHQVAEEPLFATIMVDVVQVAGRHTLVTATDNLDIRTGTRLSEPANHREDICSL